jgi:hypothetical protein
MHISEAFNKQNRLKKVVCFNEMAHLCAMLQAEIMEVYSYNYTFLPVKGGDGYRFGSLSGKLSAVRNDVLFKAESIFDYHENNLLTGLKGKPQLVTGRGVQYLHSQNASELYNEDINDKRVSAEIARAELEAFDRAKDYSKLYSRIKKMDLTPAARLKKRLPF